MVQFLLQNKKEALADYEQAIKLKPDYVEAYFALGNYYFDSENLDAAITNLTKAISLNRNLFELTHSGQQLIISAIIFRMQELISLKQFRSILTI